MKCVLLLIGVFVLAGGAPAAPLNLLLVTADDMNADSTGFMGSKLGATPLLDAVAATTYRFEQCHVSAPICQPSRSAFMTGRVPHRNGALGFHPIRTDVPTLVELLRDRGYFTAAINKIEHMAPKTKFPWNIALNGSGKDPTAFRAHVEQCLRAAKEQGKPFFLNANITDPHRPFPGAAVGEKAKAKAKAAAKAGAPPTKVFKPADVAVPSFLEDIPDVRREVAQYFTGVARFDQTFGGLMDALGKAGHADDTLIVFLSDHGMSFPFSKASVYRNGTSSPVALRWPGMPKTGADRTNLVSSVDILPTILEILGVPEPGGLDGRSWVPLVRGEKQAGRDHVVTHVNTVSSGASFVQRCVRTPTHSYMWHAWSDGTTKFRVEAMSGQSFNALAEAGKSDSRIAARVRQFQIGEPEMFFDLTRDPDERNSLIRDPSHRGEVERLRKLLLAHMERTQDPQLPVFQKNFATATPTKNGPG
jgi:N-sulfoglucosamine sulfohydrolase